jgi:hypothetical protein
MIIPDPARLMRRFEHVRTLGHLAVLGGIFCGPVAELVLIAPAQVVSLEITKILLLAACAGTPPVVALGGALMVSEAIAAEDEKPDMRKGAPAILATAGIMAMMIQALSLFLGHESLERYVVCIVLASFTAAMTLIAAGAAELAGKRRRKKKRLAAVPAQP